MLVKRGNGDFPKIYRPFSPFELYGQEEIKNLIDNALGKGTFGHAHLFYGASGSGKTSCARMIGMGLLCEHGLTSTPCCECNQCKNIMTLNNIDFKEFNSANITGIDFMRNLRVGFHCYPWSARYKIYVFDECHRMSEPTQNMLLKEVEDVEDEVYFIFCSTNPAQIIEPLKNRCMPVEFKPIENDEIRHMLLDVCELENIGCKDDVMEQIIHQAQGLPRNALILLQKAVNSGKVQSTVKASDILSILGGNEEPIPMIAETEQKEELQTLTV